MKRIIASLAVLALLATGAFAQTSDPYNNSSTTPTNTSTTDNNTLSDPNATTTTDADMNDESLPATASPLPLLALSGMGMIATGAWLVRRRRPA